MKMFLILMVLVSMDSFGQSSNPNDTLKLGSSGASDKSLIFETGDGASNKKLSVEKASKNLKWDGNFFQLGDGNAASDKTLSIGGASKNLMYNGTLGEFNFSDTLGISAGESLKTNSINAKSGTETAIEQTLRAKTIIKVGTGAHELRVDGGKLQYSNDGATYAGLDDGIVDATTTVKGRVKLAGDLGGTADLPTVPSLADKAPIASPTFTGSPAAPTATSGTNTTQISTTAFVTSAVKIVQRVHTQTGALATGTTIIPADDTIPVITEGDQYMTLQITPKSASNILHIQALALAGTSIDQRLTMALFMDAVTDGLAASHLDTIGANPFMLALTHSMVSGTTSQITFRIRIGAAGSATTTFNGGASSRLFGGVAASSITINEYLP